MKKLFFIAFLIISMTVNAQFVHHGSATYTVQQVKDNAVRYGLIDKTVRLQGYIVEHIREDYYLFKDDTGTIRVEIYGSSMPSIPFTPNDRVVLTGEVDLNFLRPEIFVSRILLPDQLNEPAVVNPTPAASNDQNQYNDYH